MMYSQYRDEVYEEGEEPDLSLFHIGMGDSPDTYADSYAEEVSIERHHAEIASFRDEASSLHTDNNKESTTKKSRKTRSASSSRRTRSSSSAKNSSVGCCGRTCDVMKRYKFTVTFLVLVLIGVAVAVYMAVGKTAQIVERNANSNPRTPTYVEPSDVDATVLKDLRQWLGELYSVHNLNVTALDDEIGQTAPRFAMLWMASDPKSHILIDEYQKKSRFALATLYYATNMVATEYAPQPRPWRSARGWLTRISTCDWLGVRCNEDGFIFRISLERNRMSGRLPMELSILGDTLNTLDLTSNTIQMSGDDFNVLETLPNLEHLYLDDNFLVYDNGLPPQMATLTQMKRLRLSYNLLAGQLEGQYPVLENMRQLTHLELESNFFNGTFPQNIATMDQLVYIYMRRNDMNFTLDWLSGGRLTNLFSLWLEGEGLSGTIPNDIGLLTRLASLSLTDSKLTGTIPTTLGQLTGLRRLWLYGNKLHGEIPQSFNNLASLELAEFHNNSLWGSMPTNVCKAVSSNAYEHASLTADCLDVNAVRCDNTTCCTKCM
ncbi:leucine rich repeat LRR-containing protein [Nitzschia inconspicua]|uniref:Leucine rich repeat LRR-containing protein n=1 Tax=Nitzschia inconspicua TaxID=303405 RepID=A0A9K3KAX4_9STRA|nr:leucine rich repeat LRR-containing protein [Nitzschia inconspicua]